MKRGLWYILQDTQAAPTLLLEAALREMLPNAEISLGANLH